MDDVTRQFRPVTDTILTLGATLVMGVIKLIEHGWQAAWTNGFVWIGYFLGCFIAQGLSERVSAHNPRRQMRWLLLIDVVAYALLASLQTTLPDSWLIFFLGTVAGYELTIFRQVGGIAINNGIMTGNTKAFATSFYRAVINRDHQAGQRVLRVGAVLVTFLLGCAIGVRLADLAALDVLWVASGFKLILLGWLFLPVAMENP